MVHETARVALRDALKYGNSWNGTGFDGPRASPVEALLPNATGTDWRAELGRVEAGAMRKGTKSAAQSTAKSVAKPTAKSSAKSATTFAAKFPPLQAVVLDPEGMFSGMGMVAALQDLEPLALRIGAQSPQLAKLYDQLSLVHSKRGCHEEVVDYGERCLSIHSMAPALTDAELFLLHFRLGAACGELDDASKAVRHFRECVRLMPAAPDLEDIQRLGVRQDLGFWLHEAGDYAGALANNLGLLADAEAILGADNAALTDLLTNLAQNQYKLGDASAARAYLLRSLDVARLHQKAQVAFDMLFQLGVLAHEMGDNASAADYFNQRLTLAESENEDVLREQARATLEEFRGRSDG